MYNITRYVWNNKVVVKNQRKLAEKIGMNECHLSVIINKKRTCPTRTAMAIANALGIEIKDCFTRL